ncbi:MAG: hypothetical protein QOJ54_3193 [Aliidongia sp.]|jgi:hypothetical protein|nr:hypothetical protein [Aliidongia sp.]
MQPAIVRPEFRVGGQSDRGQQMRVDIADTTPEQGVTVDESQNLCIGRAVGLGQIRQRGQHHVALPQIAERKLANDERMGQDHSGAKHRREIQVIRAQMIDPD